MFELAVVSFTTFFATVGPVEAAVMFASLASRDSAKLRRRTAVRGVAVASMILLFFALFGEFVLASLGISLAALRTAGGILLLLLAVDMVFARDSGATTTTPDETAEARRREDIAVFPLATPLIAGPGAMGACMLMMADAGDDWIRRGVVIAMLVANMILTLALLWAASAVQRLLGVTGSHVVNRVSGVLLAALAVQFFFDGIRGSGLLAN